VPFTVGRVNVGTQIMARDAGYLLNHQNMIDGYVLPQVDGLPGEAESAREPGAASSRLDGSFGNVPE
jgi:hypothetical protein